VFLFLHTANGILLARKSRVVGRTGGGEQRRWITGTMGNLMSRAFKMSNDVYAAMLACAAASVAPYRRASPTNDAVKLAARIAIREPIILARGSRLCSQPADRACCSVKIARSMLAVMPANGLLEPADPAVTPANRNRRSHGRAPSETLDTVSSMPSARRSMRATR